MHLTSGTGLGRYEVRAHIRAARLNHPNILTIHEIGSQAETHFIATEFIDGDSLRQHISRAQVKLPEMLDIVIQYTRKATELLAVQSEISEIADKLRAPRRTATLIRFAMQIVGGAACRRVRSYSN